MTVVDIARQSWRERAACLGKNPRWWDLSGQAGHPTKENLAIREKARAICYGCHVRAQCLADALGQGETGVMRGAQDLTGMVDLTCASCHKVKPHEYVTAPVCRSCRRDGQRARTAVAPC